MMITRRSLLAAAGLAAAAPRLARAATPGIWAVNFDGAGLLQCSNPTPLQIPPSAQYAFVSYMFSADQADQTPKTQYFQNILTIMNGSNIGLQVSHQYTGKNGWMFVVYVFKDGTHFQAYSSKPGTALYDGGWHWHACLMDTLGVRAYAAIDGAIPPANGVPYGPPFAAPWAPSEIDVGNLPRSKSQGFIGNLAEVYCKIGDYINPTLPRFAEGFYKDGEAVRQAPDGRGQVPGIEANLFLSGPRGVFELDGAVATYDFLGSRMTPAAPFAVSGGVSTADSDPWNPAGSTSIRRRAWRR